MLRIALPVLSLLLMLMLRARDNVLPGREDLPRARIGDLLDKLEKDRCSVGGGGLGGPM